MVQEDTFEEIFTKEEHLLIKDEYNRLKDLCYLDHTGAAPYSKSQIQSVMNDLMENVYSNPHSGSLTGKHSLDSIDQIRYKILHHFNTNPDEYSVVFTSGATAALKLVAESFTWTMDHQESFQNESGGDFVYMEDNHTSVLGMREVVSQNGANVRCLQHNETLDIFRSDKYSTKDDELTDANSLFVYSAQCNFSGVKYPLSWINKVKLGILDEFCGKRSNWYCLLDAASYISTNSLDLSIFKPDFVCISFYKLFGYPTGLGALLVRNTSAQLLHKPFYGGGTVLIALSSENSYIPRPNLHERFEDGTLNFLSILSLDSGFKTLYSLIGDMENVSKHCFNLAKYVFYSLLKLHHSNGSPAIHLYADTPYEDIRTQGNIVNFNVLRANGDFVGYAEILHLANLHGIQLRTGCFCNPGACRRHLGLTSSDLRKHYQSGHVCGDDKDLVNGVPTGSVRVSFGPYSTKEDADKLLEMIKKCFIEPPGLERMPFFWRFIASNLKNKFNPIENKLLELKHSDFMKYIYYCEYSGNRFGDHCSLTIPQANEPDYENAQRLNRSYISHIFLYPVKSCGRLSVSKWQLTQTGLKYDRNWMIVNSFGVALTQKREPKMCKIRPKIDFQTNRLYLSFEGYSDIYVDLENSYDGYKSSVSLCQSKVCGDRIHGLDCGEDVALWISTVLHRPGLRLLRQFNEESRLNKNSSGSLSLANQAQYLLINEESVFWLANKLKDPECPKESMLDRFRCNFAISGIKTPFVERSWENVRIGTVNFTVDGPCSRCQMICINQDTGDYNKEPLTVLSANFKGKLKFGIYLSTSSLEEEEEATLSVGDTFQVCK
uniref:Molybdenum cofactor sulfurase n=1 Tax=Rhodnius prolixus TaxID=13249 RepID=T1HNR8_RHOPR